ncbi:glycoside hydrolase family 28 protein [Olivibacter sp. SDN3]|nr:glycoside hydrolase family 28 protein [Olivibacter sp. SDN3]
MLMMINACQSKRVEEMEWLADIPTANDVGASALPDTIAPISAPFSTVTFHKPDFPDRSVRITDKGATEEQVVTGIIQSLINEVAEQGGGRVVIPKGKWKTGRINLKSNVNLHVESGAELHFSGEIADYLPAVFTRNEGVELMSLGACIYANGQKNIAITGEGKLLGPAEGSLRRQIMTHDVIENVVPLDKPVGQRVYEGADEGFIFPPMLISPINCEAVYIEGVSLARTAFWNIVPIYCDNVIIRGVTIHSVGIPRGDGIDVESSKNVLIEYCTLITGDDCLAMKAGRGTDGLRVNRPTENVVVRYCLAEKGHGGITIGSETAGVIKNLYVHDCVFNNEGNGIRFKTRRPRGGGGEKLYYERIRMRLEQTALRWDMLGSAVHVGAAADRTIPIEAGDLTPYFRDIYIKDIVVEQASQFVRVDGIPEAPLSHVEIQRARVNSDQLFRVADAENVCVENAWLKSPDTAIHLLNAQDIRIRKVKFEIPTNQIAIDAPKQDQAISLKDISYVPY